MTDWIILFIAIALLIEYTIEEDPMVILAAAALGLALCELIMRYFPQ